MVRSARLEAVIDAERGEADVRVVYVVEGLEADGDPLRLEALDLGAAAVDSVSVGGAFAGHAVLAPEMGAMRAASLVALRRPTGDAEITLRYRVTGAVDRSGAEVRVRIPVVVLDVPPASGGERVFRASVRLPAGWAVSGGFPTGFAPFSDGSWQAGLAVVPALVSLRGRTDGAWRPGLAEALDVLALAVLVVFGLVGWRHLSRVASGARP